MRSPIFLLFLLVAATAQDGECHAKDGTCRNAACQDYEPLCLQWAEQGKCDIVASSCPWSCEVCQSAEIPRVPEDTSSECLDRHPKCEEWAEAGECVVNPAYMLEGCQKSCNVCIDVKKAREEGFSEEEILKRYRYVHGNWGAKQPYAGTDSEKTKLKKVLHAMHKYALHNVTAMPLQSRLACTNEENQCGFWAAMDECENNLQFMLQTCPLACQFCDERSLYERCKDQSSGLPWLQPTEMRTKLQQQWSKGGTLVHGSTSEEDSPWVLQFEHFLTDKEADAMVAKIQGLSSWNPSPVVAAARLDDNDPVRRNSRSLNEKDVKLYESIISKLSKLLGAPVRHFEYELVHYAKMQSFGVHHDFRPHDVWKPAGPRVISLILCLSDVTKGGAIGFPDLDWLFIPPQKGQLIVWPNVLSSNLRKRRPIMSSEGLPVLEGEKYVLHAWVHLYDYEHATKQECA